MSSDRVVYGNGGKVRERLLELGMSDRELTRRTRVGVTTTRALLLRSEINTSLQLADLYRTLNELGLTPGQVLDPPPPVEPDDTPEDDISVLAGLLLTERGMHTHERLAIALEWTLDRLRDAATALDARLRPLGLHVHQNTMGVTIRPADDRADRARDRLAQLHDHEDGIHQGTARVLYAIYNGTMSTRETRNDHQLHLGALKNRGAITFGSGQGQRFALADDVDYAFNVD